MSEQTPALDPEQATTADRQEAVWTPDEIAEDAARADRGAEIHDLLTRLYYAKERVASRIVGRLTSIERQLEAYYEGDTSLPLDDIEDVLTKVEAHL